jgi:hypothetical protein
MDAAWFFETSTSVYMATQCNMAQKCNINSCFVDIPKHCCIYFGRPWKRVNLELMLGHNDDLMNVISRKAIDEVAN